MAKREYRGKVPIDQVSNYQLIASRREKELIVSNERALQLAQFKALKREANQLKRRLNQPQREIIKDHVKNGGLQQPPENLQRYASERGVMMPELAVKLMLLLILISLLLPTLVACTNTVGTEQPNNPAPTAIVEVVPTQVAPELPEGPAFAPTAEAESPVSEENPVTEEAPVAEESPEAVGTPIPDSVVIDWIAQYAPSTPTPETFAEVPVISFDNNTSFVMTGGKAYVVTRVPDSDPIVEEFAADSYEQTEDGSVNFFQGEGEARMKVAVLAKTTNGETELTPTAVPAPTPTTETPTETPTEEAPVEEETETPPVVEEGPFTVEELQFIENQWPIAPDAGSNYVGNLFARHLNLGYGSIEINNSIIKSISSITYVDSTGIIRGSENAQNSDQNVWILNGGLSLVNGKYYPFFGTRSLNIEIPDPSAVPGQNVIMQYERYLREVFGYPADYRYGTFGEVLEIDMVIGDNDMAEENTTNWNGSSDFATYGSGLIDVWSESDAQLFWETGDPQYLPTFPEGTIVEIDGEMIDVSGQHYIPALRTGVAPEWVTQ